jgi:hypothetical protein
VLSFLFQIFADSSSFFAGETGVCQTIRLLGEMAVNYNAVGQDSWHIQKESIPICCTVLFVC